MVNPQDIHDLLAAALPGAHIEILDPMRDGDHLSAIVAADQFEGLPLVKQHKTVMDILAEPLKQKLHALQLKTMTLKKFKEG